MTCLLWGVLVTAGSEVGAELVAVDVAQYFLEPHVATVLRWKTADGTAATEQAYTVYDYWREQVGSGKTSTGQDGSLQVTLTLQPGYFEIAFPESAQEFGIAALPSFAGERDEFFAIDAAMSWLVSDHRQREGLVRILRRSGVVMARERLNWGAVNPQREQFAWDTPSGYETLRRAYAEQQVDVLEMCHDAPHWLGLIDKYPANLPAAARQWRQIAQRWQATWGAVEVWNEPDIFFGGNLPGDQYVPLVKALAHGLSAAGCARPVVGGVFAHYHDDFLNACQANGMLDAIDVLSFHTYSRAPEMESLVEKYRTWLREHRQPNMPLWLTECGRPWKRGPGRPPLAEDTNSALDIVMKSVEARACGIARHFPFVYPYYEENDNNFGMMGRQADPLRSMAGYAQLIRVLAHKKYVGDWRPLAEPVSRARVFADRETAVLVVYTGRSDKTATVSCDLRAARIEGLDGRALAASEAGKIPVPDGLAYVWLDRSQLADHLNTDTRAMRLAATGAQPPRPATASPIIMRLEMDRSVMSPETKGYVISEETAGALPLRIRVFNLDADILPVRCEFVSAQELLEGKRLQTVELPGESSQDVHWKLDLRPSFAEGGRTRIEVQATVAGTQQITRIALDLFVARPAPQP
jgi:hypothetical protein